MSNISVSLPSDGETIEVSDYNTPITTIVNEINGNLDNSNIDAAAAIAGSKLADNSVTADKIDFATFSGTTTQWRTWTPTLTNFVGTVNQARYTTIGKVCEFYIEVTQGGSVSGRHTFSLPVQAASSLTPAIGFGTPIATGTILDLGSNAFDAFGGLMTSTTCGLGYKGVSSSVVTQAATSSSLPMVWAAGNDKFWLYGKYETI
jgi:hypothetical protein